jgi:ribosomal protein S18 acetylase RimI-like enzyme
VARRGGEIVGLVIAFPQAEVSTRYAATVARYEEGIGQRMEAVGWLFPVLPEATQYVFNLAVSQSCRGQGIGRLLLTAAEEQAQRAGMTSVHLDVAATSPAVQFYRRMKYRGITKTSLLEPVTSIPPHLRMHKRLVS